MIPRTVQDAHEFVRAKASRREPIRFVARGAAEAVYTLRDESSWVMLIRRLRRSNDFADAVAKLDEIRAELLKKHGVVLPAPRKLQQNSDRSLSVWWDNVMVRAFDRGVVSIIAKRPSCGVTSELLAALAMERALVAGDS